jgi:hypothetical protein
LTMGGCKWLESLIARTQCAMTSVQCMHITHPSHLACLLADTFAGKGITFRNLFAALSRMSWLMGCCDNREQGRMSRGSEVSTNRFMP